MVTTITKNKKIFDFTYNFKKVEELEKEILKFKKSPKFVFHKKLLSLKGVLKNIKISEKEIQKSKKVLFKNVNF